MELERDSRGVYKRSDGEKSFGEVLTHLERAIVTQDGKPWIPFEKYALVTEGLSLPSEGGAYVVIVLDDDHVRVLAYLDRWGRAFKTQEALEAPPAREPDIMFARDEKDSQKNEDGTYETEKGKVVVKDDLGKRNTARYEIRNNRTRLFDSWYPFDEAGRNLSFLEAMARAYLALIHRPSLNGLPIPTRGFSSLFDVLSGENALSDLGDIVKRLQDEKINRYQRPPALLRCLAQWLEDAGLSKLLELDWRSMGIRLITTEYNQLFYLTCGKPSEDFDKGILRRIESALNCFALLATEMEQDTTAPSMGECNRLRAQLFETMPETLYGTFYDFFPAWLDRGEEAGEWRLHARLATNLEKVRFPYRLEGSFRANAKAQEVSFDMSIPRYQDVFADPLSEMDGQEFDSISFDSRIIIPLQKRRAEHYALLVGLLLAREAFKTTEKLERVEVILRPYSSHKSSSGLLINSGDVLEFPHQKEKAYVQVLFTRESFAAIDLNQDLTREVLSEIYQALGAQFDVRAARATIATNAAFEGEHQRLPEVGNLELSEYVKGVLGIEEVSGLRIDYEAPYRATAEYLADQIVKAVSTTEAVQLVRAEQTKAEKALDYRGSEAATRLMEAIIIGNVDAKDQNAIVNCYLGENRGVLALAEAKALAEDNPDKAVEVLKLALEEMTHLEGFVDSNTKVYRAFGSYAERIFYNRLRLNTIDFINCDVSKDADKEVFLAPDALFWCHLEIADLLEHDFGRVEEALFHVRRALEIAPLAPAGYRQMGRTYMLVGEMEHAAEVLRKGLHLALNPKDIAMCYYQLAYVLWKAGRAQEGALCYLKSITVSDVAALQAATELKQLTSEYEVDIPARDDIDYELEALDLRHDPESRMYAMLTRSAAVCTDAGMYKPARNLLAIALRIEGDDALSSVLNSLGSDTPR